MKVLFSLVAVLVLTLIAYVGTGLAPGHMFFGVVVPYLAMAVFLVGLVLKIVGWARIPVPFRIPTTSGQQKSLDWIEPGFDAAGWLAGEAAVGYDENEDYRTHIATDVESLMLDINATAYLRIPFSVSDPERIERLTLWVKYDDGFIAYINGVRAGQRNAPDSPAWNSEATGTHGDAEAVAFESVDLAGAAAALREGANVLAVHGLNAGAGSSDFLIVVELDARMP